MRWEPGVCVRGSPSQKRQYPTRPNSPHHISPGILGCADCTPGSHLTSSFVLTEDSLPRRSIPVRLESTRQEETCQWPVSHRPGWVSQLRQLTPPLSCKPVVPICPPASLLAVV